MKSTIFFGLSALALGLLILASVIFGYPIERLIYEGWPLLIVGYGLFKLLRKKGSRFVNIVFMIIGMFIFFSVNDAYTGRFWTINFGILFLIFGAGLLIKTLWDQKNMKNSKIIINEKTTEDGFEFDQEYVFEFDDIEGATQDHSSKANADSPNHERKKDSSSFETFTENVMDRGKEIADEIRNKASKNKSSKSAKNLKGFNIHVSDDIRAEFLFASEKRIYKSNQFRTGSLSAVFSDVKIDLSRVTPTADRIQLNVNVLFAEVSIRIPKNWAVSVAGNTFLGETSTPDHYPENPVCTLIVQNSVAFGELNIVTAS